MGKGEGCEKCKGTGQIDLTIESQESIEYLSMYVDEILAALKEAAGIQGAFVTDGSAIDDFQLEDEQLKEMSEILRVDCEVDLTGALALLAPFHFRSGISISWFSHS